MRLLSAQNDKSSRAYAYHHGHGERCGCDLTHEEKSEDESDDCGRREEHGCWRKDARESGWLGASGGAVTIGVNWVEPAAGEGTKK